MKLLNLNLFDIPEPSSATHADDTMIVPSGMCSTDLQTSIDISNTEATLNPVKKIEKKNILDLDCLQ